MQHDGSTEHTEDETTGVTKDGASTAQCLIVLCGLIGSGKSSFANALQLHYPEYIRCNQDALGSRKAVLSLATRSLQAGKSVMIDRTNVDEGQRSTWVDLANSFTNVEIQAIYFDTPIDILKQRLALRTDHETLRDPQHALQVLQHFSRDLQAPKHTEGFSKIISVTPADFSSAIPTKAEVDLVMQRLADAPRVDVPIVRAASAEISSRGRGRGGRWQSRGSFAPRGGFSGFRGSHQSDWRSRGDPSAAPAHNSPQSFTSPAHSYQQYQYTTQNQSSTAYPHDTDKVTR